MQKKYIKAIGALPEPGTQTEWTNSLKRGRVPGPRTEHHTLVGRDLGISTKAVHAGQYKDPETGAVGTPIFQTTAFLFDQQTYDSFSQGLIRDALVYSRYGNPSQWTVQEKIASLEGAESAVLFSSGMAAITSTLLALTNRGGHIVSSYDVYGGTYDFLREELHQLGRSVTFVDPTDLGAITAAVRENTQAFFFETLTNPLLKFIPLTELAKFARANRILLIVDNTFLSPVALRPLEHGADVVIHSCTKYLNGHSDLTAGVAAGSRKYLDRVWALTLKFGGVVEPLSCFLLERGLKTLALRVRAQQDSAAKIARFLFEHPKVARVYYPTLPDYPYPWITAACSNGFGGVVSFVVNGGDEAALALLEALEIPHVTTSLGGVESLVSLPFNTSHSALTDAQRHNVGILPGLVRFSVGVEDSDDLIRDLSNALDSL
jgi:cystathionine gamma-lyase / homocysteine desulfhydrase